MTDLLPAGHFAGHTTSAHALHEIRLVETTYDAGQVLRSHAHERAHLCFVLGGTYTESVEGADAPREPFALTFLPSRCAHGERHHTSGRHFIIELEGSESALFGDAGAPRDPKVLHGAATLQAAKLYAGFRARGEMGVRSDLIWELLACCTRPPTVGHPRWLTRTRESIRDRYTRSLSLDGLANEAGVHPVHLAQSFRRVHGTTVGEFVRQLRVEHACRALINGGVPLSAIAAESGFADQAHLTRCFRKAMAVTPGEYRRMVGARSKA